MKRQLSAPITIFAALAAIAAVFGNTRMLLQRIELRSAIETAQLDVAELPQLETEHRRLTKSQVSLPELTALRADHEALMRLRAELSALTKGD